MKKLLSLAAIAAVVATTSVHAQDIEKPKMLSPGQIVDQAPAEEWQAIAANDLLIMKLIPDAKGTERKVIIQLMPFDTFSVPWTINIRRLARKNWWDGTSINRVQDNYVVQWGDAEEEETKRKAVPRSIIPPLEQYRRGSFSDGRFQRLGTLFLNGQSLIKTGKPYSSKIVSSRSRNDSYAATTGFVAGWPAATDRYQYWPVHCYGSLGVGRGLSPDAGNGTELYTVIGHSPRHLDRNIAVVGRIIEGMHHLSSLPRGFGPLGFYETPEEQVPIQSIRLASELPETEQPRFEYLSTDGVGFAKYAYRRANREPPFFITPAGGADICNIPVPVRRVKESD